MSNSEQSTSSKVFWESNDDKIEVDICSLSAAGLPINVSEVSDQLTDIIVSSYDNKSLYLFINQNGVQKLPKCSSNRMHSLILDLSGESWKKYFSKQDIAEMMSYNEKKLPALPAALDNFICKARNLPDAESFKQYLKQEFESPACE